MADALKAGDRVKVEIIEAIVDETNTSFAGRVWVVANNVRSLVPISACTRIGPEFEWVEGRDKDGNRDWRIGSAARVHAVALNENVAWRGLVLWTTNHANISATCGTPEAAREWCEARLRERKAGK